MKLARLLLLCVVAAVFCCSNRLQATSITTVDQHNSVDGGTNTPTFSAAGQTFTPVLDGIDAAEFVFDANSASLELQVYEGTGIGGTLLGSSGPVALSGGSFQTVHFDLTAHVALNPGSTYTLFVTALSGAFGQEYSISNPYAGGVALNSAGISASGVDLVFSEGITATDTSVPEPATMLLLGSGLCALVARRRRA